MDHIRPRVWIAVLFFHSFPFSCLRYLLMPAGTSIFNLASKSPLTAYTMLPVTLSSPFPRVPHFDALCFVSKCRLKLFYQVELGCGSVDVVSAHLMAMLSKQAGPGYDVDVDAE